MGDEESNSSIEFEGFFVGSDTHRKVSSHSIHMRTQSSDNFLLTAGNVAMLRTKSLLSETAEAACNNTLLQKTQDFLSSMPFWSLSQCMILLKSFDMVPYHVDNASIIQQCVSLIATKAAARSNISTPTCCSSPDSRLSSNDSDESDSYSSASLYEDITYLSVPMLERLMTTMLSQHVDNKFLAKCLLHYLQTAKKRVVNNHMHKTLLAMDCISLEVFESVVGMLFKLARVSVPCKSLFGLQRMTSKLHASKGCRQKIEEMIGFQLDKATLDDILVSRQRSGGSLYDVNLILRLVKIFLRTQVDTHPGLEIGPVKRVGKLLDKYLAEIAPDVCLTGAQFKAVAECLPDFARDLHDDLYHALDIFLEAHSGIQEEESMELCKVIDFSKLSPDTSRHAAQSLWFPPRITLIALLQEQATFKAAIEPQQDHYLDYQHHYHNTHQHQHLQQCSPGTADVVATPFLSSSCLVKSLPALKRLGSDMVSKPNHQHKGSLDNTQRSLTMCKQTHDYQPISEMIDGCESSAVSSCSSFTWDCESVHSQSNTSSRKSLYEQMGMDFPELPMGEHEQELGFRIVLQQNEELRMDLQQMQRRVMELEKACGQMKSRVSKFTWSKRLLC